MENFRKNGKNSDRKGMAVVVALIFMMALLITSTTIAEQATNMVKASGDSYKSRQAYYNARSSARIALKAYKGGKSLSGGDVKKGAVEGNWRILGVSGAQGNLTDIIGDYHIYPFPGTGTAGKDCDVYEQIANTADASDETASKKYIALLQKYGVDIATQNSFGPPEDFSCNWNKIKDNDSAIEIPLYGINPTNGTKTKIDFSAIEIRVRTACDESEIKPSAGAAQMTKEEKAKMKVYEAAGMCEPGSRYDMMINSNDPINTVLNWGIYSAKTNDYLIPIKTGMPMNLKTLNITTANINEQKNSDFVVLKSDTSGTANVKWLAVEGEKRNILYALSNISSPYLRFTVEFPFKDQFSNKLLSFITQYFDPIPHLEYQIRYKTATEDPALGTAQISGTPVIIGEGYSGGFKHTVRMYLYETKTGFDYVYQKL